MPIVLYQTDGSPPVRAVKMVIEILGLQVETKETRPLAGETRTPEYLEINPAHTIPVIEDGNFVLADSHAIITYLVSKYGADKKSTLYPNDMEIRATIDQRMYFDASIVFPKVRGLVSTIFQEKKPVPTETQIQEVHEVYGILEKYLERSQFLATDHITLADISLVASVSSLNGLIPVDDFPRLSQWFGVIKELEWYKTANEPGLAVLVGFLKSQSEKLRE